MHYVEHHLTRHHLFHAPHKWFMALLCSPIHLAEQHYQRHYHMKFENARKLFIFDLTLLISVFVLITSTAYWFLYNPEVTDLVNLSAQISENKIKSGDYTTVYFRYANNSDTKLLTPTLSVHLPEGFVLDKAEPSDLFDKITRTFKLNSLPSGHSGVAQISGWSFGAPDKEEKITTELTYTQNDRIMKETRYSTTYLTHRGSILETKIEAPQTILGQGNTNIKITLKNTGTIALYEVKLPLPTGTGVVVTATKPEAVNKLLPNEATELAAILNTNLDDSIDSLDLLFTPNTKVNQSISDQATTKYSPKLIHPKIKLLSWWAQEQNFAKPGEVIFLTVSLENNGDSDLTNVIFNLPIPTNIIDAGQVAKLNGGQYKNQTLSMNKGNLKIGQKIDIQLKLPILDTPQGEKDLVLELTPNVSATVDKLNTIYETNIKTPSLKIGTALNLSAEIRYYTVDGDQLGRGPLPPQVGKETKYWALMRITNSTSQTRDIKLIATLPDYIVWTGKSSVSQGQDLVYNATNKTVSWQTTVMEPGSEVGLYFELGLTPTSAQTNTTPILVKNITLFGHDTYVDTNITQTKNDVDASLTTDIIGKNKGIKVR